MHTRFNARSLALLGVAILLSLFLPLACKRSSLTPGENLSTQPHLVALQEWWHRLKSQASQGEMLSRIPDTTTIQAYWQAQFENGTPKWTEAICYTLNGEPIYGIPFQFPDNLQFLNEKPDASLQPFLSKGNVSSFQKTSTTYLIIKPQAGRDTVAEIMSVVLDNAYIKQLDSTGEGYPTIHLSNVYPANTGMGSFTGSVKFYDLHGVQLLEEGYAAGTLVDYLSYGRTGSAFRMNPEPDLSMMRSYQICTYTYVYQQNCAPDAGCTDWIVIGVIFNGCETIVVPDSPPILPPIYVDQSSGGGTTIVIPPSVQPQEPIPNARLCGTYIWRTIGNAEVCQIRNFGALFVKENSTIPPQHVILGLTCITIPKWYKTAGYDITEFINYAYNQTVRDILKELNNNLLPPGTAMIEPRFKTLFRKNLAAQPGLPVNGTSVTFHDGCIGEQVPTSQPRYCAPI